MVKEFKTRIASLEELPRLAKEILRFADDKKIFAFYGEMGSGKTTIIKELCRQLGSQDSFSSPSYSVVNEYQSAESKIYHIDLYRLKNIDEALAIGIEEYLNGDNYCFIEWPELIESLLPREVVNVELIATDNIRNVRIFIED